MSVDGQVYPDDDSWVVAVHESESSVNPIGSGIVLDEYRILTCAHIAGRKADGSIWAERTTQVWVAFPKVEQGDSDRRLQVERAVFPAVGSEVKDVAMLYLSEPVPPGVAPAPLRCPRPGGLIGKRWWAFGFPEGDPIGNSADGRVGAALTHGWVRLDTDSRYSVQKGFSGGGLWSADYQATVAVVIQAGGNKGDGRAITLHQVCRCFPEEKIDALTEQWLAPQAGEVAMAAWGWSLNEDREGPRHWRPRARGVSIDSERGYRFRGRTAALETIKTWLDRSTADRKVLTVTGAPGAGKSAILGRIVTTADPDAAQQLPASDTGVRATVGSVGCAVHAKAKTALEVAAEIARAASAELPERIEDFVPALRDVLEEQGRKFNVIIDALDEAATPSEARSIITKVILPVAETCADAGAQVIVGTRRAAGEGDLVDAFDGAAQLIDLDDSKYFAEEDLEAYALTTLQLTGAERSGSPYADDAVAGPVAARIAELSKGNFLVAGLTARTHGQYDETAAVPADLSFSSRVDNAMREYLKRISPVRVSAETPNAIAREVSAETLLTPLAFAETPGLPVNLWRAALRALGAGDVPETELIRFARSSAVSFLVESSGDDGHGAVFRLFHQALNDALRHARGEYTDKTSDERVLARAFLEVGRAGGWDRAPAYLLRSLPVHAAAGGVVDDLLADDDYLLHADLRRVLQVADQAVSRIGQERARLVGLTLEAVTAGPASRAAMFGLTETLDGLGFAYQESQQPVAYRAQWAVTRPRRENLTLNGHRDGVNAVCAVPVGERMLLATGGDDMTVRLWDPADGAQAFVLKGHPGKVNALCAVSIAGRTLLATASARIVRLWDPVTGTKIRDFRGHMGVVYAMCSVVVGERVLLATASDDGTARLWDPADGTEICVMDGHQDWVNAVCALAHGDRTLLATGSGNVRLWDPVDGSQIRILEGHQGGVNAVCSVAVGARTLLATASDDGTAQLWDSVDGTHIYTLRGHQGGVYALCSVPAGNRTLLATASDDGTVRLWDPADGTQVRALDGHQDKVTAVCAVQVGDRILLVTTSGGTARLWDLRTAPSSENARGHRGGVVAVCTVTEGERTVLASGSNDGTARLWDLANGSQIRILDGHRGGVNAVCSVSAGNRTLLATGGADGTVRLWDPAHGTQVHLLEGHWGGVYALCSVSAGNRTLLATGGADGTVRLWDPADGTLVRNLKRHRGGVRAMCALPDGDRTLLAAASGRTVRLWDLDSGIQIRALDDQSVTTTNMVYSLCPVPTGDRPLLATANSSGMVRLWDPVDGVQVHVMEGHHEGVRAVRTVSAGDRALLATASDDGTVRLWNLTDRRCLAIVPVHHRALSAAPVADLLALGLTAGVLVIKLEADALTRQLPIVSG